MEKCESCEYFDHEAYDCAMEEGDDPSLCKCAMRTRHERTVEREPDLIGREPDWGKLEDRYFGHLFRAPY